MVSGAWLPWTMVRCAIVHITVTHANTATCCKVSLFGDTGRTLTTPCTPWTLPQLGCKQVDKVSPKPDIRLTMMQCDTVHGQTHSNYTGRLMCDTRARKCGDNQCNGAVHCGSVKRVWMNRGFGSCFVESMLALHCTINERTGATGANKRTFDKGLGPTLQKVNNDAVQHKNTGEEAPGKGAFFRTVFRGVNPCGGAKNTILYVTTGVE